MTHGKTPRNIPTVSKFFFLNMEQDRARRKATYAALRCLNSSAPVERLSPVSPRKLLGCNSSSCAGFAFADEPELHPAEISMYASLLRLLDALSDEPESLGVRQGDLVLYTEDDIGVDAEVYNARLLPALRALPSDWEVARLGWYGAGNASHCVNRHWMRSRGPTFDPRSRRGIYQGTQALLFEAGWRAARVRDVYQRHRVTDIDSVLIEPDLNSYVSDPPLIAHVPGRFGGSSKKRENRVRTKTKPEATRGHQVISAR